MLKLKKGFVLRNVAGEWMALATGTELDVDSVISLNDTGAFLWKRLVHGDDVDGLTAALLADYDVEEPTARACAEQFVARLSQLEFLEEC